MRRDLTKTIGKAGDEAVPMLGLLAWGTATSREGVKKPGDFRPGALVPFLHLDRLFFSPSIEGLTARFKAYVLQ
jgi:hypothetical protein